MLVVVSGYDIVLVMLIDCSSALAVLMGNALVGNVACQPSCCVVNVLLVMCLLLTVYRQEWVCYRQCAIDNACYWQCVADNVLAIDNV